MRCAGNKIFVVLASVLIGSNASGAVGLGIDLLESNGYALLKNKRVGLIANQTGVDSRGVRGRGLLRKNCNLFALYAPEHGLDGMQKAGRYVLSRWDPVTGLAAHSSAALPANNFGNVARHRYTRLRSSGHRLSQLQLHEHNHEMHGSG